MSRFSGPQFRGAARVLKETRRKEAEARQKNSDQKKAFDELREFEDQLGFDIETGDAEVKAAVENPGPALPGLAKRARKITRK